MSETTETRGVNPLPPHRLGLQRVRAYHHLPLCPACALGIAWASLGIVVAVGRTAWLLFGATS